MAPFARVESVAAADGQQEAATGLDNESGGRRRWVSLSDAEEFAHAVAARAEVHADIPRPARVTRDPGDDYLVALSVSSGARLVTDDADLMDADLDPPALSPRDLRELLDPTS